MIPILVWFICVSIVCCAVIPWVICFGILWDLFKVPKTSSIMSLAARGNPPSNRQLTQWQWPLDKMAPGGRVGSARQNWSSSSTGTREASGGSVVSARRKTCCKGSRGSVTPSGKLGVRQAVTMQQHSCLALGAWRCVMPAKRSRRRFRLALWDVHQAVLVQWWCAGKGFYNALRDVHDAMLWLGAQLRVHLVLG